MEKPKKKIVHLLGTLERGGAEMSLLRMLPPLNNDIESIFVTLRQAGSLSENFNAAGIDVISIDQKNLWDIDSYRRLRKILKEISPDLVITHLLITDIIGRFFVQTFLPCKVISSLATTYNFPRYWAARWFEILTSPLCAGYMANAESVKNTYVKKFKVPERKITVVPTGMDLETFSAIHPSEDLKRELSIHSNDTVIICVANLHINKGHAYLLGAFEKLYQKRQDIKLLIVGDGVERDNLLRQLSDYRSKNAVILLGKRPDVPQLLAISNIFVLPTFFEGMCNAIMEAMAIGLPIVTTNITENKELVTHEETGLLCPVKDIECLEASLDRLVSDKSLARKLGKNATESMRKKYNLPESILRWKHYFLSMSK